MLRLCWESRCGDLAAYGHVSSPEGKNWCKCNVDMLHMFVMESTPAPKSDVYISPTCNPNVSPLLIHMA
jgi:hypothetical protein